MGMTIDENIESLENMKSLVGANHFAINMAISTMRKYQKIQEIVNSKTTRFSYELGVRQIRKVVEDGNDD